MQIRPWASQIYAERLGVSPEDFPDIWTAMQFDAAVSYFGAWVENKLNQFDSKTGKALHSLEDLIEDNRPSLAEIFRRMAGVGGSGIRVRKVKAKE